MSLQNINARPRFTQHLVAQQMFAQEPLVVVDVGARGGFEQLWSAYGNQVELIGFEADPEECAKLNQQETRTAKHFYPIALHRDRAKRCFYVTALPDSSGFYPADLRFIQRFPDEANLRVVKTVEMDTVDFDSYAVENNINKVDFIKLDTEGSELDILMGAIGTLKRTVIGISVEVEFQQLHVNQPLFWDVNSFLEPLGFRLYDLAIYRQPRKSLRPTLAGGIGKGQVLWGQALYLRDGMDEIEQSAMLEQGWDDVKILKLASLMDIFCLSDCAIELIQSARTKGYLQIEGVDHLIDLLVPTVSAGRAIPYQKYLESLQAPKHRGQYIQSARNLFIRIMPRPARSVVLFFLLKLRDLINEILK